jgi:hypothetical protein
MAATIFTVGDFIRRVVDSLLRGDCRGKVLCSRCLVKLTKKGHLDRSYTTREVVEVMEEIFVAPGPLTHDPASTCAACARKRVPCLGAPA